MKLAKILFFFLLVNNIYAQECGTELLQSQIDYMNQTRTARAALDLSGFDNATTNIPLTAHIIRTATGTGGLSESDLNTSLAQLNTAYEQVDFEFELCLVNYIDNDDFFDEMNSDTISTSKEYQMATPNLVAGTINVFFLPNAPSGCGWASFPAYITAYNKDWIVVDNDCAINGSTLAHEIGHYFNVYHTHECLNGECELVDGSNCGPNVGDELCDTSADPILLGCVDSSCTYTCTDTDANGDTYDPDTENIMSYSQKYCRTVFSPQQITRIQTSYLIDRNYLESTCICLDNRNINHAFHSGDVEDYETGDWIQSTATINSGANITFDAGNYICLNTGFEAKSGSIFEAFIDGCGNLKTASANQMTFTAKEVITGIHNYPNPFDGQTTIEYILHEANQVSIDLYDLTGKKVRQILPPSWQEIGKQQITFEANNLPSGTYVYRIQTDHSVVSHKLILLKNSRW